MLVAVGGDTGELCEEKPERPIEEVETEICALSGQIAAATARYLMLVADFDARRGWASWQLRSCSHWLSWKAGVSLHTAREHVRVARALVDLPLIAEAFAKGTVSYSKVRAITRVADDKNESTMLRLALEAPAAHIDRLCRGLTKAMRPTKKNGLDEHSYRGRWFWDEDDGSLVINARLRPEDGARLLAALTRSEYERTRVDPELDADKAAPAPRNIVPALTAMAEMVCAGLDSPVSSPSAEVIVHVEAAGEDGCAHAHLDDGPGLEAESLAQVMCEATMRTVRHGSMGTTISWSTTARTPSRLQVRALLMRDRCCAVPGCGRVRFLNAHHVQYYSRQGPTTLENMVMLCSEHHRALHDGYFSITSSGDEHFTFRHADGREVLYAPAMQGDSAQFGEQYSSIASDAIIPDWQGESLDLSFATDVLIRNWERAA
ncbi:HNH endonuclease signature motif containing protein [Rhodococcoides yunnanense]|uniref:HNH endonuclease signature motif containing protein n=1 Tax=Rhodococcoides yunnanense TaxID=278209 RepID=UPI0009352633|nr:HNH endonuclease signature motif containing protein [Rhodococcus yunnanensis]